MYIKIEHEGWVRCMSGFFCPTVIENISYEEAKASQSPGENLETRISENIVPCPDTSRFHSFVFGSPQPWIERIPETLTHKVVT
jgi:hypothetical protein